MVFLCLILGVFKLAQTHYTSTVIARRLGFAVKTFIKAFKQPKQSQSLIKFLGEIASANLMLFIII